MDEVSVRELRNFGGQILDRVASGESMTVTRDGAPIAQLAPLTQPRLSAQALIERWRHVPVIDAEALRGDLERVVDLTL